MAPTPTLPQGVTRLLLNRQDQPTTTVIIDADPPNNDGASGSTSNNLDGGAIAGIVIGTVVGILLLWWIIRACTQPRDRPDPGRQGWYDDTTVPPVRPRSRSRSTGRHHHHHYDHHHHSSSRRSGSRHHSRRRSSTPRPVMVEERYAAGVPVRPAAAYYAPAKGRRSRSRSQGRYYVSG